MIAFTLEHFGEWMACAFLLGIIAGVAIYMRAFPVLLLALLLYPAGVQYAYLLGLNGGPEPVFHIEAAPLAVTASYPACGGGVEYGVGQWCSIRSIPSKLGHAWPLLTLSLQPATLTGNARPWSVTGWNGR